MTDLNTVTAAKLIEHLESQLAHWKREAGVERRHRRRQQADANHWRAEARLLAEQRDQLGDALRAELATAVQASEDTPGQPTLAAAVRQARRGYKTWETCTDRGARG